MIRTTQTSLAPPPLPPRLRGSQPILIPAQLPPPGNNNKPLIHFLAGVVIVHFILSVGGFIYLFYKDTVLPDNRALAEKRVGYSPLKQHEAPSLVLARMAIRRRSYTEKEDESHGLLKWENSHSFLKNINFYKDSWLTILKPGEYYVYSRVTFSKGNPKIPLESRVKLRKSEDAEEKTVMIAYCSLSSSESVQDPHMCTATQTELISLEKGNQLSVWVQNLSYVDYDDGATTFGMYKLQDTAVRTNSWNA